MIKKAVEFLGEVMVMMITFFAVCSWCELMIGLARTNHWPIDPNILNSNFGLIVTVILATAAAITVDRAVEAKIH